MAVAQGSQLGPFEILNPIGAGGMGEVYKARDTRLDRLVAIKILPPQVAAAPELRDRFEREGRAISQLNHQNICTLFDVGEHDQTAFLVMEYLEGETLAARIAKGPIPVEEALPWAIQIADALNEDCKPIKGSKITLLGMAYKKDVDDLRESPSLKIIEQLTLRGAKVDYNDPHFPQIHKLRHYNFEGMKSVPIDSKTLASYDCVLIATDHTNYDYSMIVESAQLVVDTRNATKGIKNEKIFHC